MKYWGGEVNLVRLFDKSFNRYGFDFNVNLARVLVCLFFLWKLLSRDFSFYGYVPEEVFGFYPVELYKTDSIVLWTGLPILTDVLTMHWVHWFVARPTPEALEIIQGSTIFFVSILGFYGRGPKKVFLLCSYCLLVYLWGNLILLGQEIDSVALYFGMLLVLGLSKYKDCPVWSFSRSYSACANLDAGRSISGLYLVLVTYYFGSGLKKLTDITFVEWFKYDLIETMEKTSIVATVTSKYTPSVFEFLFPYPYLGVVLPSVVYLSHIFVPIVYFYRRKVVLFFLFYAVFHFMTFGVAISFTGYILVWGCLFHYREWLSAVLQWRARDVC